VATDGSGVVVCRSQGIRRERRWGVVLICHDLHAATSTGEDVVVLVPHEHDEPPPARPDPPAHLSRREARKL